MTIQEITKKICAFRDERDWMQFHNPKDLATAISIESAELLEHFLWKTPDEVERHVVERSEPVREEIADIAIYLFELAQNLNVDLSKAIEEKLAKNAVKYPVAKAKGTIKKYTEFEKDEKPTSDSPEQLRAGVYDCKQCASLTGFVAHQQTERLYKFPPIIGKRENAEILFIGINPRRSKTNLPLHNWLMESLGHFAKLAANRLGDGKPYIAADGEEEHYHCHMIVLEGVYSPGIRFEEKAAVTEMYHCVNGRGAELLNDGKSPCAERYLARVIQIVKPKVVIAIGAGVRKHLEQHFPQEIGVPIVAMEHPSGLFGKSPDEKRCRMQSTIDGVRRVLQ